MREPLRRWFVPNPGNGYFPRFWRSNSVAAVLAVALLAASAGALAPLLWGQRSFLAAILPATIVDLTNDERAGLGESELAVNPLLEDAARAKAEDMATRGYFAHWTPEGLSPWHWLGAADYAYVRAGENLAVNFDDSGDVVDAWMNSPTHRANIAKGTYTEIGVGMARGRYDGRSAIYVVQFFGTPQPGSDAATVIAARGGSAGSAGERPAATTTASLVSAGPAAVAGAATDVAASPRSAGSYVLWALLGLVTVAFAIAVLVAVRIQFRAVVLGGLGLILALAALLWLDAREGHAARLLGGQAATSTEAASR